MGESFNDSQAAVLIPQSKIRTFQFNIRTQLEDFKKEVFVPTFLESSNICDRVRDEILNSEDEPYLSKTQNHCRRIFIASELFLDICSIYGHIVDNEFTKTIRDIMEWEKLINLTRKIKQKVHIELKREKYFAAEAQNKILKGSEAEENNLNDTEKLVEEVEHICDLQKPAEEVSDCFKSQYVTIQVPQPTETTKQVLAYMESTKQIQTHTEIIEPVLDHTISTKQIPQLTETTEQSNLTEPSKSGSETEVVMRLQKETSMIPELVEAVASLEIDENFFHGNLTQIREEPITLASKFQDSFLNITRQDLSLPNIAAETSIMAPKIQQKAHEDDELNQILQILEGQKRTAEIEQPENLLQLLEQPKIVSDQVEDLLEASEELILPSLESVEDTRKKQPHVIIDKETFIPDYASRALQLNRNINIQRVQVFEGPPRILQAISAAHLMTTQSFRSSLFQGVRSSKLSKLYKRHLEVQKKPVETIMLPKSAVEQQKELNTKTGDFVENIEVRAAMSSDLEKSVLAEVVPEKSLLEDLDISGVPVKESLVGIPVSRIISPIIKPPGEFEMGKINTVQVPPTPRVHQLQGKSIDLSTTSTGFLSTKENPPSAKYREFNYVFEKLQNYWSLFKSQGLEKCITLKEFFSFEDDGNYENYLTVLRIVDKLSIQRKLILEYKNPDVFIFPFEKPYVSDEQLLLIGKEIIF